MRVVLAIGCFDILHAGHVQHLQEAKEMGDYLIVGLTLDDYVNKGPNRPIHSWEDRAFVLAELKCVDEIIPNESGVATIRMVRPDVFVKGLDASPLSDDLIDVCCESATQIRFTSLRAHDGKKLSSSDLCAS